MYQSFFLTFKAVEFRPASGKILYAFIFYISLKQIIALAFHSELPLGTVCFIGEKKKKISMYLETKQEDENKVCAASQIPPSQAL